MGQDKTELTLFFCPFGNHLRLGLHLVEGTCGLWRAGLLMSIPFGFVCYLFVLYKVFIYIVLQIILQMQKVPAYLKFSCRKSLKNMKKIYQFPLTKHSVLPAFPQRAYILTYFMFLFQTFHQPWIFFLMDTQVFILRIHSFKAQLFLKPSLNAWNNIICSILW